MNKLFTNALTRFLEIKKIDGGNWMLLFILFVLGGAMAYKNEGEIVALLFGGIFILVFRSVFLLYYFFGKFSNTRFNIITIIFMIVALQAIFNFVGS